MRPPLSRLNTTLLIPLLLCCFVAFSSWAVYQAATGVSEISDRDYYSKGLKYTSTLLEQRAAQTQGWTLRSELSDGSLIQYLTDKTGAPISGAAGILRLQRQGALLVLPLEETAPGVYRARLPRLSGEHQIRAEFERNGARILRRLLVTP